MAVAILRILACTVTLVSSRALQNSSDHVAEGTLISFLASNPTRGAIGDAPFSISASHSPDGIFGTTGANFALPPPASDALWNKCLCKGGALVAGMSGSDRAAGQLMTPARDSVQSRFVNFPYEFQRWFYHLVDIENSGPGVGDLDEWGVGKALRALKVNDKLKSEGGKNAVYSAQHWDPKMEDEEGDRVPMDLQTYEVDGDERPVTGARFDWAMNVDEGVILAFWRSNPKTSVTRNELHVRDDELPDLAKSSDIAWGLWSMAAQGSANKLKGIKYFFSLAITNDDTLGIIARVANNGELKEYPGERFDITDQKGKALLGTPNGICIGYLLMQHKQQIGNMYVTAVSVFHCSRPDKAACLLYEVDSLEE